MSGIRLQWDRQYAEPAPAVEFACDETVFPRPSYDGVERFLDLAPDPAAPGAASERDRLIEGDALAVGQYLLRQGYAGRFRMIYLDPPYLSKRRYTSRYKREASTLALEAFDDCWQQSPERYLEMLYQRLLVVRDLLMDNGSIFLHLDWHSSHYGRMLLEEIWGKEAFVNELVWCYAGGSAAKRHFQHKHDLIFWYAQAPDYVFNPQYRPYSPGTLQRGLTAVKGDRYRLKEQGAMMQDWWSDVPKILSPTAFENMKYPTQKPRLLLQRLIAAASDPGDLVGDFFAGSSTTAEVCSALGRRWIMADIGPLAVQTSKYRLIRQGVAPFTVERAVGAEQPSVIAGLSVHCEGEFHEHMLSVSLTLKGAQGLNPQELVDYWEIDYNYDGERFNSRWQILRQQGRFKGELPLAAELVLLLKEPERPLRLAVRVRDFYCRCQQEIFVLRA